jgi:enamine deaminase RidA (YjgF/YER057c/UK114 family)
LIVPDNNPVFGGNTSFENARYSAAVSANGLLFISGQVGFAPDGTMPDELEPQADNALRRVGEILRLNGLSFADLVELVTYHVDIKTQFQRFVPVKNKYITADFPAWTAIGVAALARPPMLIEIKATAVFPVGAAR